MLLRRVGPDVVDLRLDDTGDVEASADLDGLAAYLAVIGSLVAQLVQRNLVVDTGGWRIVLETVQRRLTCVVAAFAELGGVLVVGLALFVLEAAAGHVAVKTLVSLNHVSVLLFVDRYGCVGALGDKVLLRG